jgi:hypothetical protein
MPEHVQVPHRDHILVAGADRQQRDFSVRAVEARRIVVGDAGHFKAKGRKERLSVVRLPYLRNERASELACVGSKAVKNLRLAALNVDFDKIHAGEIDHAGNRLKVDRANGFRRGGAVTRQQGRLAEIVVGKGVERCGPHGIAYGELVSLNVAEPVQGDVCLKLGKGGGTRLKGDDTAARAYELCGKQAGEAYVCANVDHRSARAQDAAHGFADTRLPFAEIVDTPFQRIDPVGAHQEAIAGAGDSFASQKAIFSQSAHDARVEIGMLGNPAVCCGQVHDQSLRFSDSTVQRKAA